MRRAAVFVVVLAMLAAAACNMMVGRGDGDDNRFSDFVSLPDRTWLYTDRLEFVPDTLRDSIASEGMMLVAIRHSSDYPYRNIWLEVSYRDTDSALVADTLNVELADIYGNFLGKGMGLSFQVIDTVPRPYTVAMKRPVGVRHIMRLDTLRGIEQVGVVFIPREWQ